MPLRPLPAAILLGLVALPFAAAQGPAADPTVTVSLPADYATNDTIAVIPFTVGFSVSQFTCLGGSAQFTVALEATATASGNSTNGSAPGALVQPSQLTFDVSPADAATGTTGSEAAVATVTPSSAGQSQNATLTVTATVTGVSGCTGGSTGAASATGSTAIQFERPAFADQGTEDEGQKMPGLGLVALLAALGVALLLRRDE